MRPVTLGGCRAPTQSVTWLTGDSEGECDGEFWMTRSHTDASLLVLFKTLLNTGERKQRTKNLAGKEKRFEVQESSGGSCHPCVCQSLCTRHGRRNSHDFS